MDKNLGQIFHDGRIINLRDAKMNDLNKIINDLRESQFTTKERIDMCLKKMKENR